MKNTRADKTGPQLPIRNLILLSGMLAATLTFQAAAAPIGRASFKPVPVCNLAAINNDVLAEGLGHNSFDTFYRDPFGAVPTNQGHVTLRFRTCQNDVTQVRVRVWNSVEKTESWIPLVREAKSVMIDPRLGPVEFWKGNIPIPVKPTLLYYFFEITDSSDTHYYNTDTAPNGRGGWGRFSERWDDFNTYQITVYSSDFHTPDWFKGSVMYQILPDRFRNGDPSNDPKTGEGFVFGKKQIHLDWNQPICDPRGTECPGQQDNQFYGGDLQGVLDKLDYLKDLGVNVIYFNPIFLSATNHRYDTQDYLKIDPKLGTEELFTKLVASARERGIRIILDGVFNHGSADSPYFDLFHRWPGVGACESVDSIYRSWFYFPHFANIPVDHARPGTYYYCANGDGSLTTYEAWWGYYEHPVYRKNSQPIRDYFFSGGPDAVGPYWIRKGTAGWRLDVAGDVAPGEGVDPSNDFWQGFRAAIKAQNPDAVMIGEEWSNASPWLLGHEWDSATNYRFRAVVLDWLADHCQGDGCTNGDIYQDNDNNSGTAAGPIIPIDEAELDRRLRVIEQDTPPEAWQVLMNPLGSHDTQRVRFVLKKISGDDEEMSRRKLMFASLFQFTYPGVPVIYYADEAGARAEGKFYDGEWKDDPYNRVVYPWSDRGLQPDPELIAHFARLGKIRNSTPALKRGDFETLLTDTKHRILAFRRVYGSQKAWIILNRSPEAQTCQISLKGTGNSNLQDILNGTQLHASDDLVNCGEIPGLWGRILIIK